MEISAAEILNSQKNRFPISLWCEVKDIVGRWNSLSIYEDKEGVLEDWLLVDGALELRLGLIGKVLSTKSFNRSIFKEVMSRVCKVEKGLEIKEIGQDVFVFSSSHEVRIFNLPHHGMTEGARRYLGNNIGRFITVDADKNERCWAKECVEGDAVARINSGNFDIGNWLKASRSLSFIRQPCLYSSPTSVTHQAGQDTGHRSLSDGANGMSAALQMSDKQHDLVTKVTAYKSPLNQSVTPFCQLRDTPAIVESTVYVGANSKNSILVSTAGLTQLNDHVSSNIIMEDIPKSHVAESATPKVLSSPGEVALSRHKPSPSSDGLSSTNPIEFSLATTTSPSSLSLLCRFLVLNQNVELILNIWCILNRAVFHLLPLRSEISFPL
ncbi:hypothetical protein TorRG33x02_077080 [Trema orientale]|uniref:DUF4283 domain-containing protein n=1 Tax=Trema orientale TaxID=63057 RepID=A0A2P5FF63_TREOI|nr:hypothetical protein TorRG33x02_077080 [Trema orientale]